MRNERERDAFRRYTHLLYSADVIDAEQARKIECLLGEVAEGGTGWVDESIRRRWADALRARLDAKP